MALKISGTAREVAAYLASLGEDVEVTITTEQAPAVKAPAPAPAPAKRGPGRPKAQAQAPAAKPAPAEKASGGGCAVIGCEKPARSKGYCAAHYQKYNNLKKTGRAAEFGWTDDAAPQTVTNPTLPRGRAGAKAKAEAKGGDEVDPALVSKTVKAVPPRIRRAKQA